MSPRIAFHIGYHKTASTWFQEVAMPRHPQIGRFLKIAPARDSFLHEILMTPDVSFDPDATREIFTTRVAEMDLGPDDTVLVSAERLCGHGSTGGYDSVRIATRLAAVVPEARIFWVVREQVGMLESEYRQLVREGTPAPLDAFLHGPTRLALRVGFDLRRYEYDLLADQYVNRFSRPNVHVFELGALAADPRSFLDQVAEFLDIAPWPAMTDEELHRRVNPSLPRRLMATQRFMNHFAQGGLNPYPLVRLKPFWREPLSLVAFATPRAEATILRRHDHGVDPRPVPSIQPAALGAVRRRLRIGPGPLGCRRRPGRS